MPYLPTDCLSHHAPPLFAFTTVTATPGQLLRVYVLSSFGTSTDRSAQPQPFITRRFLARPIPSSPTPPYPLDSHASLPHPTGAIDFGISITRSRARHGPTDRHIRRSTMCIIVARTPSAEARRTMRPSEVFSDPSLGLLLDYTNVLLS